MPREYLPLDLVARLDPVQVKDYAKATGWVREQRLSDRVSAVFSHPLSDLDQIIVPLLRNGHGYGRAMGDVIEILGEKEKRPAVEILNDLLLPPADVLRFNESGPEICQRRRAARPRDRHVDRRPQAVAGGGVQYGAPGALPPPDEPGRARSTAPAMPPGPDGTRQFYRHRGLSPCAVPEAQNLLDQTPFGGRVTALLMRSLERRDMLDADELDAAEPDRR